MRTTSDKYPGMRLRGNRKLSRSLMVLAAAVTISLPVSQAIPAAAASQVTATTAGQPWLNRHQSPERRTRELLAVMTLAQKLQLVDGTGFSFGTPTGYAGHIAGIPSLGIPDLYLADGAVGVGNGSTGVTQFPDGTNDAATWDPGTVRASRRSGRQGASRQRAQRLTLAEPEYPAHPLRRPRVRRIRRRSLPELAGRRRRRSGPAEPGRYRHAQALHRERPGNPAELHQHRSVPAGPGRDLRSGVQGVSRRRCRFGDVRLQPGQRLLRLREFADDQGHPGRGHGVQGLRDERLGRHPQHRRLCRRRAGHADARRIGIRPRLLRRATGRRGRGRLRIGGHHQ